MRNGETILVLDRKTPVAELRPVSQEAASGKLGALERKGIVHRGNSRLPNKFFKQALGDKRAGVLKALLDERERER